MINVLFGILSIFFITGILAIVWGEWCKSHDEKKYRKKKRETEVTAEKEYIQSKVNQENDPQTILKVVEGRKQRARDLGVEEGIMHLFFGGGFSCYKFYKSAIISNYQQDTGTRNRYLFTLKGRKYTAQVVEGGVFELLVDDKNVLALKMSSEYVRFKDYDPLCDGYEKWWCSDIESFIEGVWVEDLRDLIKQIDIDKKEERRKQEEDPDRINKLKEGFGI